MKTRVLIIEDNCYKSFTTKQVLEAKLHMAIRVIGGASSRELVAAADDFQPDLVVCRPTGGVGDLLASMQKRNVNRRNTEIALLVAEDMDNETCAEVQGLARRRLPAVA